MKVNIKKLNENAVIPTRGSDEAAGYDLYAYIPKQSQTIPAGETKVIGTGIAMEIPKGYVGLVYARSGLATKRALRPANCVGVIDSVLHSFCRMTTSTKCSTPHRRHFLPSLTRHTPWKNLSIFLCPVVIPPPFV